VDAVAKEKTPRRELNSGLPARSLVLAEIRFHVSFLNLNVGYRGSFPGDKAAGA
jgi:hypothetical protein